MRTLVLALAAALAAAPAAAQHRTHSLAAEPAPWAARADTIPTAEPQAADSVPQRVQRGTQGGRIVVRGAAAAGGMFVGFWGGVAAGIALSPGGGDDDLGPAIGGALVGGLLGTGLGAALPSYGGRCGVAERTLRGVLGAGGGILVSALASQASGDGVGILIPITIVGGAAFAADC